MRATLAAVLVAGLVGTPVASATASGARSSEAGTPLAQVVPCNERRYAEKPPPWASEMPKPRETTVTKEDVQIESKDGTLLSARVYLPDAYKGRLPTVLILSPYWSIAGIYFKELEDVDVLEYADCITEFLLVRGYAVVLGDMRGTHNSDGCFDFGGPGDQWDGYSIVQWIAKQKWSNGKVGMYGASHVGMSQYAAAVRTPPALKAIIPTAPITSFYRYLYNGGVHYETNMLTPPAYEYVVAAPPPTNYSAPNYVSNLLGTTCNTENVVRGMSLDGTMTEYWRERDYPSMAENIETAVFHVHGTLDENVKMDHFGAIWDALEEHDVTRKALIGPWGHAFPAIPHWELHALRWYEHFLRGNDTGVLREPRLTLLDQERKVRHADSWPPTDRTAVLHAGAGALSPRVEEATATYQDVPQLPRQLLRSATGARLIYTGTPLRQPLRLSGAPVFEVVAAIDRTDTNFAVHLFDVDPAGNANYVTRGYLDAQHRDGLEEAKDVEPGKHYRYRVVLHDRDYVFGAGHALEVVLSSSDSCMWLIGGSLGERICRSSGVVSDPTAARVTVKEGRGLTRLILPVAPD